MPYKIAPYRAFFVLNTFILETTSTISISKSRSKIIHRIAVGTLFFLLGLCFASWASRIPTIRQNLNLSDSQLGFVLFSLPIGSLLSLPVAGWLVNKSGSKKVVIASLIIYSIILLLIGLSSYTWQLIGCLFLFGWLGNTANISVNTQALGVQNLYGRSIMASFHGLWSLAGFTGAATGTFMIAKGITPSLHFLIICLTVIIAIIICFNFTLPVDNNVKEKQPFFVKPDKALLSLGLIAFCSMMCEGAMFDWSGIYFQKVVHAKTSLVGAGYASFMSTMAAGRFIADWFNNRFGLKFTLQASGILIAFGLLIAIIFPYFGT
ncbi:MAG TPA: MFS transporter, partial [Flavisolibacter sp.]|nr:MFS transporter [Flavisolibacter sp.]